MSIAASRDTVHTCAYCPKLCRDACPVARSEHNERLTPAEKGAVAAAVLRGELPLDAEAAATFYACTSCGASRPNCKLDIDASDWLELAKEEAVRRGAAPAAVGRIAARMRAVGAPYDRDLAAELRAALPASDAGGGPPRPRAGTGATVLFAGCDVTAREPERVADALALARAGGMPFPEGLSVYTGAPFCCGYPLAVLGHREAFAAHVRRVGEALAGAERVLCLSPACAEALGPRAASVGARPAVRVAPFVSWLGARLERLAPAIDPAKTASALPDGVEPGRVLYHDPCVLGRRLGVFEAPRRVLAAALGGAPGEFPRAREQSACAGGGGGYPAVFPDGARRMAGDRIDEARRVGAQAVATACPTARRLLARASEAAEAAEGEAPLPVVDLIALAASGLRDHA